MKILVTGFTSPQASPDRALNGPVTFAWLIARILRSAGYEVDHRTPGIFETFEEYDHVIVGVQAPHAVGSNRMYVALNAIGRAEEQGKLSLFIDDLEMNKILGGIRTMRNNPERFLKQFYWGRPGYEVAVEEPYRSYLYKVLMRLLDYQWPPTLLPLFPWSPVKAWEKRVPNAVGRIIPVDPSAFVPEYPGVELASDGERKREWVTETPESKWYRTLRPVFPVKAYGSTKHGYMKRPSDEAVYEDLAERWGVLHDAQADGWFDAMLVHAARAGALAVCPWNRVDALGGAYSVLPDTAAEWDEETRGKAVVMQRDALESAVSGSRESAMEAVQRVVIDQEVEG